jgi:hypothetical protein
MVALQVIRVRSRSLVPSLYTITHIMVVMTTTILVTMAALQEMLGAVPKGLSHPVEYVRVCYLLLFVTCWEMFDLI